MGYLKAKADIRGINLAPLFPPEEGKTVILPTGSGTGFWAGAPTIMFDEKDGAHELRVYKQKID